MRLLNKNALVTGGSMGIGEAVVRKLHAHGANIVIEDMCCELGIALAAELTTKGPGRVVFCKSDVTVPESVENAVNTAVREFGSLDILINDAGVVEKDTLLEEMSDEVWFKVLNVNLNGTFLNCKYSLPQLKRNKGCIVSMSSTSGLVATLNDPAYCASKTGIIGLMRAIACDYGKFGVRANAVCPTSCCTPMFENLLATVPEKEREALIKRLGGPCGRLCTTDEVANAVLFLASPQASYINGTSITVDGAYTAM